MDALLTLFCQICIEEKCEGAPWVDGFSAFTRDHRTE